MTWIRPSESLPKVGDEVLIATVGTRPELFLVIVKEAVDAIAFYEHEIGYRWSTADIAYWMPIPELPKEGDT